VGLAERLDGLRYTTVYCRTLRCPARRYGQRPAVRPAPGGTTSARRYTVVLCGVPPSAGRTVKNLGFSRAGPLILVRRAYIRGKAVAYRPAAPRAVNPAP